MTNQLKKVRNIKEFMDKNSLDNALVVAKNCYMNKITKWSTQENKLALIVISKIKTINKKGLVCVAAEDVKKKLDIKTNSDLRRLSKKMLENSFFEFDDADGFKDGFLMFKQELSYSSGYLYIGIDSDYLPLFQNLSSNFTMIPLDALLSFSSKYSIILTQFINSNYDLKKLEEETIFGNREQLWGLFGLDDTQFLIKPKTTTDNSSNVEFLYTEDGKKVRNMGYKPPKEPSKTYRWPDFESRILKRAVKEINDVSSILGYTVSYYKKIAKSDIGHYVDGYYITITKAEKKADKDIFDVVSISKQIDAPSKKTIAVQLKEQRDILIKAKGLSKATKKNLAKLTDGDFKRIESNITANGNIPTVPNKYFQKCILNYLLKPQQFEKHIVELPSYYKEMKETSEKQVATQEEIEEVEQMLKAFGKQ